MMPSVFVFCYTFFGLINISSSFFVSKTHITSCITHQSSLSNRKQYSFTSFRRKCYDIKRREISYSRSRYNSRTPSSIGSTLLLSIPFDTKISVTPLIIQTLSALSTYIGLVAYYDRPTGKLYINENLLSLKQSQVQNAGLGLYVTESLPKGTILGTYPGVLRPSAKFLQKYKSIPQTAVYTWRFTDNEYCIDPTNKHGELPERCYGGTDDYPLSYIIHEHLLRGVSVPTYLAR